jgi:glycosyltransferase involved in cell wall biosynthesis
VGCPDARPPAYEAVAGLAGAGRLSRFVTSFYAGRWAERVAASSGLGRKLRRRWHAGIPPERVQSTAWVDCYLALEGRAGAEGWWNRVRLARERTERFDRLLARVVTKLRPEAALLFSDVGSEHALPRCGALGIARVVSMVHGDVVEEQRVLEREAERRPDWFRIYLGDGPIDRGELAWLHERRLRDLGEADIVLVPSRHTVEILAGRGEPREKLEYLPYAADVDRFQPAPGKRFERDRCTFLFTGGITQRKGVADLLEAWEQVKRPGWRLRMLGGMPREVGLFQPYRESVEWLGRVGHGEVAEIMSAADVFVFPSLFEGSAVVTYEALACGLPSIVTAESGSVARDGIEGMTVPAAAPGALAAAMERLGLDGELRAEMARAARARALEFDWKRHVAGLIEAIDRAIDRPGSAGGGGR